MDESFGKTKFGGIIMHGMTNFGLITRMMTDWAYAADGVHRRLETRWRAPVKPGDTITPAGIGGLTAALSLHATGITDVTVAEAVLDVQPRTSTRRAAVGLEWQVDALGQAASEYFHGDTGIGLGPAHRTGWKRPLAFLLETFSTPAYQKSPVQRLIGRISVNRNLTSGQDTADRRSGDTAVFAIEMIAHDVVDVR